MSNCRPINKIRNRKYDSIIRSDHHRLRPRRAGSSCIRAESTAEHIDFGKSHGDVYKRQRCSCVKTYEYKILNRKIELPTERLYSHFCYFDLDLEKMQQAAVLIVGEHDFKSFCNVRTQVKDTCLLYISRCV